MLPAPPPSSRRAMTPSYRRRAPDATPGSCEGPADYPSKSAVGSASNRQLHKLSGSGAERRSSDESGILNLTSANDGLRALGNSVLTVIGYEGRNRPATSHHSTRTSISRFGPSGGGSEETSSDGFREPLKTGDVSIPRLDIRSSSFPRNDSGVQQQGSKTLRGSHVIGAAAVPREQARVGNMSARHARTGAANGKPVIGPASSRTVTTAKIHSSYATPNLPSDAAFPELELFSFSDSIYYDESFDQTDDDNADHLVHVSPYSVKPSQMIPASFPALAPQDRPTSEQEEVLETKKKSLSAAPSRRIQSAALSSRRPKDPLWEDDPFPIPENVRSRALGRPSTSHAIGHRQPAVHSRRSSLDAFHLRFSATEEEIVDEDEQRDHAAQEMFDSMMGPSMSPLESESDEDEGVGTEAQTGCRRELMDDESFDEDLHQRDRSTEYQQAFDRREGICGEDHFTLLKSAEEELEKGRYDKEEKRRQTQADFRDRMHDAEKARKNSRIGKTEDVHTAMQRIQDQQCKAAQTTMHEQEDIEEKLDEEQSTAGDLQVAAPTPPATKKASAVVRNRVAQKLPVWKPAATPAVSMQSTGVAPSPRITKTLKLPSGGAHLPIPNLSARAKASKQDSTNPPTSWR
eukprot:ANDGO_02804.mRNA.1 hypothetical protein